MKGYEKFYNSFFFFKNEKKNEVNQQRRKWDF